MAEGNDLAPETGTGVFQLNHQTLHVHVHNVLSASSLTGRVEGSLILAEAPVPDADLHLYFGPVGDHPVATSRTGPQGAFAFDDLPPGFYGLRIDLPGQHLVLVHNLRVLPGESCQARLVLASPTCPVRETPDRRFRLSAKP
jgi:hypothetical protein